MNVVVKWSVVLAILVAILSLIVMATGLQVSSPMLGNVVSIVLAIAINVIVIYLALSQTAAENGYGKQLMNGALIGLVGGVLIFLTSWLLLAVVFPDYLGEVRESTAAWLESMNLPPEQLDAQIERLDQATPLSQSIPGLIGTFVTSLVVAAIVAIFKRRK